MALSDFSWQDAVDAITEFTSTTSDHTLDAYNYTVNTSVGGTSWQKVYSTTSVVPLLEEDYQRLQKENEILKDTLRELGVNDAAIVMLLDVSMGEEE